MIWFCWGFLHAFSLVGPMLSLGNKGGPQILETLKSTAVALKQKLLVLLSGKSLSLEENKINFTNFYFVMKRQDEKTRAISTVVYAYCSPKCTETNINSLWRFRKENLEEQKTLKEAYIHAI